MLQILEGFERPFGLFLDKNQHLYVTDMDTHTISIFDEKLERVGDFRTSKPLNGPHSIAISEDDRVFICEYYAKQISVWDTSGEWLYNIDKRLKGPATATLLPYKNMPSLCVTEYGYNEVCFFELGGKPLARWQGFDRPHMTRRSKDGYYYIADTWNGLIRKYDAQGNEENAFGGEWGMRPVALDFINDDTLLITDWEESRLLISAADGARVEKLEIEKLHKPYDALYQDGLYYVADSHHHRVLVFRP